MGEVINHWCIKISLTEKCNYRCFYCNDFQKQKVKYPNVLDNDTIKEILKAAREAGVQKVHWTGGEPSINNLILFSDYAKNIGYEEQYITTNGFVLYDKIDRLITNGLTKINISLDSLDAKKYENITGVDGLEEVLKVIKYCANRVPLTKVNVALMRENIDEILDLVNFMTTLKGNTVIKFFELWKFEPLDVYSQQHISPELACNEISKLGETAPLNGVQGNNINVNYFTVKSKRVNVGIVPAPVNYTCGGASCKKIRVYTNGKTCEGKNLAKANFNDKVIIFEEIMSQRCCTIVDR